MPSHPHTATAWRSRREEYLWASGRQSDLVKEGFEPAPSTASWSMIPGGRPTRLTKPNLKAGLFLVKNAGS
jgi:hypothetical protein